MYAREESVPIVGKHVLIAEARAILRTGLLNIFKEDPGVSRVDEVVTSEELKNRIKSQLPDLIVIHQSLLTDMQILSRGQFVILAAEVDKNMLLAAHASGALGYLSENASAEMLRMTLSLAEREFLLDPAFTSWILYYINGDTLPSGNPEVLTVREQEIFELLRSGLTNHSIATQLGISESTVKSHIARIFRKLDMKRRPVKRPPPSSNATEGC